MLFKPPYKKLDAFAVGAAMLALILVFWVWMPSISRASVENQANHLLAGIWAVIFVFMALALYGTLRFSAQKSKWAIGLMVLMPAFYGGVIMGGLRSSGRPQQIEEVSEAVRPQEALAALWWGRRAALALPEWSRGGTEAWPSSGGGLLVYTEPKQVRVDLSSETSSRRECLRLLADLSGEKEALAQLDGSVLVNGKEIDFSKPNEPACNDGGMMSLVVALR